MKQITELPQKKTCCRYLVLVLHITLPHLSSHQAQHKELFIQERYGRYNLSDPFLALQRDNEAVGVQNKDSSSSSPTSNPLVVLKLVVSHCRRMQEKMLAQLTAAESRHRRVGVSVWLSSRGGTN